MVLTMLLKEAQNGRKEKSSESGLYSYSFLFSFLSLVFFFFFFGSKLMNKREYGII